CVWADSGAYRGDLPGVNCGCFQLGGYRGGGIRCHHGEKTDAHVPGAFVAFKGVASEVTEHAEHWRWRPGRTVNLSPGRRGQYASKVCGDPATGHVAKCAYALSAGVEHS